MANEIESLVNQGYCDQSNFAGTSTDYCHFDIARLKSIWRHPRGYKYPVGFQFTYSNILIEQQKGNIVPVYPLWNAEFVTPDNGVQTFGGGHKATTDRMPVEIKATMREGVQGYQAIKTIERAGQHSFTLIDQDGTVFVYEDKDGRVGGFTSDFFQVGPYKGAAGDSAMYAIEFQLDRRLFDTGLKAIVAEAYDFDIEDVQGVQDLQLTLTAPTNGASTISFTATRKADLHDVSQLGLDTGNLLLKVNGVNTAWDGSISYSNGVYTIPVDATFATGQTVTLHTLSNYGNTGITQITDTNTLVKSNVAKTVVL